MLQELHWRCLRPPDFLDLYYIDVCIDLIMDRLPSEHHSQCYEEFMISKMLGSPFSLFQLIPKEYCMFYTLHFLYTYTIYAYLFAIIFTYFYD